MGSAVRIGPGDALLLVDVQNDFCPGGALAVPRGDEVVVPLNGLLSRFVAGQLPVVATRDWHPADHSSFAGQGGRWPPHCVQGTRGASFRADLELPCEAIVVSKGTAAASEGYSGFEATDLGERLRALGVRRVVVGGLATDYCVRATVLDARKEGFEAVVVGDACRGIDAQPGDVERALEEMRGAGASLVASTEVEA